MFPTKTPTLPLARISHREGAVIARGRVDPSWIRSKSVAIATVEALSAMGGRLLATLRAGVKSPAASGNPLARCAASRFTNSLACRAFDTRDDPFPVRNPG